MRRIHEFDGLRGLAALVIMIYHRHPSTLGFGWSAVDLFFVLSGYLITGIILRNDETPHFLRTFYIRRSLRIWPIYYLFLIVVVLAVVLFTDRSTLASLPYFATYTQNLPSYWSATPPRPLPGFEPTWTLAIEEQFYIVWPLALLLVGRRGVLPMIAGVLGVAFASRYQGFDKWLLITRCDGFALGGLLAVITSDEERFRRRCHLLAAGFVTLALIAGGILTAEAVQAGDQPLREPLRWPVLQLFCVNLLAFSAVGLTRCFADRRALAPLRAPGLTYLGKISYGMYLYHSIVFLIYLKVVGKLGLSRRPFLLDDLVCLGLVIALAALSWRLIERPILALKDRFDYDGQRQGHPPFRTAVEPEFATAR